MNKIPEYVSEFHSLYQSQIKGASNERIEELTKNLAKNILDLIKQ